MLDLRLPGQQYDSATGFNYNYFRDYDPSTGRYVESDPIGINGGVSTYAYVGANPIAYIDLLGLEKINLFPEDHKPGSAWYAFNLIPDNPDECIIGGHGSPFRLGRLNPQQLAVKIANSDKCVGKRIILYACNTGVKPKRGTPYGRALSNETGQVVGAPNNWGWLHYRGIQHEDGHVEDLYSDYAIGPSRFHLDYTHDEEAAMAEGKDPNGTGDWVYFFPPLGGK